MQQRRGGASNVIRFNLKFYFNLPRPLIPNPRFCVSVFDQWLVNDTILSAIDLSSDAN